MRRGNFLSEKTALISSDTFLSKCVNCNRLISSKYIIEEGYRYLVKTCPYDGTRQKILLNKQEEPEKIKILKDNPYCNIQEGDLHVSDERIVNKQLINLLVFDITAKCNSSCPICVRKDFCSNRAQTLSVDFIKEKIKCFKQLDVLFSGGEPTVVEELPEMIREVSKKGFHARIFTNGLKLADRKYLKKLVRAGLKYVHFSFDGFNPEIYERIRGGKHEYGLKLKALRNIRKEDVNTSLEVTLVKGVNDDQVKNILDFAFKNDFICEIVFRPLYLPGVDAGLPFDKLNVLSRSDICDLLENASNGEVSYELLRAYTTLASTIPRLVKKPIFFSPRNIYLERAENGFRSVLSVNELNNLKKLLKAISRKDLKKVVKNIKCLNVKQLLLSLVFVKNKFNLYRVEKELIPARKFLRICFADAQGASASSFSIPLKYWVYGVFGESTQAAMYV